MLSNEFRCKFNLTFVHYVEQKLNVDYRYFKSFEGYIRKIKKVL